MTVPPTRPPAVAPGSRVAITATSSPVTGEELARLVTYFEQRAHPVKVMPSARTATGYLAGSAAQRAADLMAAFTDPDIALIVPATGGKGAAHLLDLLDYDTIRAHPTVLTGISDPSILLNAIVARSGVRTLHGPSGYDFFQPQVNPDTEAAFWRAVTSPLAGIEVPGEDWRVVRGAGKRIVGPVVGGHLGTIRALVGTPWMPPLDGAVLILEEICTPWVGIDAALTHLRLAGVFDRIAALLVGVPVDCPQDDAPDDSWERLITRCVGGTFPVVTGIEFGHTPHKIPLPIGGTVELQLTDNVAWRYIDNLIAV